MLVTQSETSTGVVADVRALAAVAQEAGALIGVDAISSLGAIPCETDEWGLDSVVSGSQKALMAPPGLSMVSVSAAAWEARTSVAAPRFYLDWERTRKAQELLDAAFTPAVSIVIGLNVALGLILERGLDAAFERHVRPTAVPAGEGVKAMGLDLFSPDDDSSAVVTTVRVPEPWTARSSCSTCGTASGSRSPRARARSRERSSDRPHRLLRRLRHHYRARRNRARARRGRRGHRAGVAVTRALETYEHQPA